LKESSVDTPENRNVIDHWRQKLQMPRLYMARNLYLCHLIFAAIL